MFKYFKKRRMKKIEKNIIDFSDELTKIFRSYRYLEQISGYGGRDFTYSTDNYRFRNRRLLWDKEYTSSMGEFASTWVIEPLTIDCEFYYPEDNWHLGFHPEDWIVENPEWHIIHINEPNIRSLPSKEKREKIKKELTEQLISLESVAIQDQQPTQSDLILSQTELAQDLLAVHGISLEQDQPIDSEESPPKTIILDSLPGFKEDDPIESRFDIIDL